MNHEVFICYDPKDEEISTDISNLFESNNIKTWVKSKDYGDDDSVHVISDAIRASDAFVLIYSENSKNSNFVKTEIDIAFSSNVPILIYKIDESGIDEKLGFYLKDKPTIESFNPKEKYPVLLNDVAGILNKTVDVKPDASEISIPSMNHVFICYDENDEDTANGICHTLEQNYIRCWIKNRDLGVNESVYNIKENIESADAVVLIHSANAEKSNFVNTESDIAMTESIPIILYKIDKYIVNSKLKDYVGNNRLDAYPDINSELENLVKKTSEILKNPVQKPVVKNKLENKVIEEKDEIREEKVVKEKSAKEKVVKEDKPEKVNNGFFNKKIIAIIGIIAIIAIVAVFASGMFTGNNGSSVSTGNTTADGDYVVKFNETTNRTTISKTGSINPSGITIKTISIYDNRFNESITFSNYSYYVWGKLGSDLTNADNYVVNTSFYDSNGKLITSSQDSLNNVRKTSYESYMVGKAYLPENNVDKIVVTLYENNNVVGTDTYQFK